MSTEAQGVYNWPEITQPISGGARTQISGFDSRGHALHNLDDNSSLGRETQWSLSRLCKCQIKECGKLNSGNMEGENQITVRHGGSVIICLKC